LSDAGAATLERVKNFISSTGDFPAMSYSISLVSKQTSPESDTSVNDLTNTILNDFALANRLLKMVNTVFYVKYQIAGKISTISRAVYVMGFSQVRNAALSLMLFEQINNPRLAGELREAFVKAFTSGVIAREMASLMGIESSAEEAFICAMFHEMGRFVVKFYLREENEKIKSLMKADPQAVEEEVVREVLGTSYERIGDSVARQWNFSDDITYSMRKVPLTTAPKPGATLDIIRYLAGYSNSLCRAMGNAENDPDALKEAVSSFIKRFGSGLKLSEAQLTKVLNTALAEITNYARTFSLKTEQIPFLGRISSMLEGNRPHRPAAHADRAGGIYGDGGDAKAAKAGDAAKSAPVAMKTFKNIEGIQVLDITPTPHEYATAETPEEIFSKGIQEVASALLEEYSLNDILRMILEVMYRGLNFARVIICIKNTKEQVMKGRFGFGSNVDAVVRQFGFNIERGHGDVFNLALDEDTDILITDARDEKIRSHIPSWYRQSIDAETFIVIPIAVMKKPIGIIYADKLNAGEIVITPALLRYFKTLRNQTLLATKQRM
jgi:HD-like signal output (HDOD) protein